MAINVDDYIFHSDWDYNSPIYKGKITLTNVDGRTLTKLASGLLPDDRFKVVTETLNNGVPNVYQKGGPFPNVSYYVKDGDLYCQLLAQAVGTTWTGTIHYRVYRRKENLTFTSDNNIEKVVYSVNGTTPGTGPVITEIDNTYGDLMMMTGIWRNVTQNSNLWFADGTVGYAENGTYLGSMGLYNNAGKVGIIFGASSSSDQVEYKIVGVKLNDY